MALPLQAEPKARRQGSRAWFLEFAFGFLCVFAGLALPSPGLGPHYARAHAAIGQALVSSAELDSGVKLSFSATAEELEKEPWQATLVITPPRGTTATVPMDLRVLAFLPTVTFIALTVAVPLGQARRNIKMLAIGIPILELALIGLMAVPMLSFLGGTGPIQAFDLSPALHTALQIVYRALVVPPGMTFALPLALWALLAHKVGGLDFRFSKT